MCVILTTTLFYKALILQGEIWCWSLLRLKESRELTVSKLWRFLRGFFLVFGKHARVTLFLLELQQNITTRLRQLLHVFDESLLNIPLF